jgi:HPt (histidine-containing phosphotransfer) domain-containing protein
MTQKNNLHKPFSEDELAEKLDYWGQAPATASHLHSGSEQLASCATATQASTILEGLTADVGVDLARFQQVTRGNVAFQKQVLQLFLQDTYKNIALAKTAIAKADFAALEHQAHQIKGASANVGVKAIEVLAEQMEQYAHQQSLEAIADLITNIEKSLELIRSVALN